MKEKDCNLLYTHWFGFEQTPNGRQNQLALWFVNGTEFIYQTAINGLWFKGYWRQQYKRVHLVYNHGDAMSVGVVDVDPTNSKHLRLSGATQNVPGLRWHFRTVKQQGKARVWTPTQ